MNSWAAALLVIWLLLLTAGVIWSIIKIHKGGERGRTGRAGPTGFSFTGPAGATGVGSTGPTGGMGLTGVTGPLPLDDLLTAVGPLGLLGRVGPTGQDGPALEVQQLDGGDVLLVAQNSTAILSATFDQSAPPTTTVAAGALAEASTVGAKGKEETIEKSIVEAKTALLESNKVLLASDAVNAADPDTKALLAGSDAANKVALVDAAIKNDTVSTPAPAIIGAVPRILLFTVPVATDGTFHQSLSDEKVSQILSVMATSSKPDDKVIVTSSSPQSIDGTATFSSSPTESTDVVRTIHLSVYVL